MTAEWVSALVALGASLISVIFSVTSLFQAKSALRKADDALSVERASSALTYYMLAIDLSESKYREIRNKIRELDNLPLVHEELLNLRESLNRYEDELYHELWHIFLSNKDLLNEEDFAFIYNELGQSLDIQMEVWESRADPATFRRRFLDCLRHLAITVNRFGGLLRVKAADARSLLLKWRNQK